MPTLILISGNYSRMIQDAPSSILRDLENPSMGSLTGKELAKAGELYINELATGKSAVVFTNDENIWLGIRLAIIKNDDENIHKSVRVIFYPDTGAPKETVFNQYGNPAQWFDGMFDSTAELTRELMTRQHSKRKSTAPVQLKQVKPFDLEAWQTGLYELVTRGGSDATIATVGENQLTGSVGDKNLVWHLDGANVIREEYGYDLFLRMSAVVRDEATKWGELGRWEDHLA